MLSVPGGRRATKGEVNRNCMKIARVLNNKSLKPFAVNKWCSVFWFLLVLNAIHFHYVNGSCVIVPSSAWGELLSSEDHYVSSDAYELISYDGCEQADAVLFRRVWKQTLPLCVKKGNVTAGEEKSTQKKKKQFYSKMWQTFRFYVLFFKPLNPLFFLSLLFLHHFNDEQENSMDTSSWQFFDNIFFDKSHQRLNPQRPITVQKCVYTDSHSFTGILTWWPGI